MAKEIIQINDFSLFQETMKSLGKIAECAKIQINQNGLSVFGKNAYARCEVFSDSVTTAKDVSFCLMDLNMVNKILSTVREVHGKDFSGVELAFDGTFVKVTSKKFKTKLTTFKEDIISKWVSKKVETKLDPTFEFTTSSQFIKTVNGHSFIFQNSGDARVYLSVNPDMENNVVYATIGNDSNELNNSITLKFGLVNFGSLGDRRLVLDFERLNILNIVQSEEIKVQLMQVPILVYKIAKTGEAGNFSNITIYDSLRKS